LDASFDASFSDASDAATDAEMASDADLDASSSDASVAPPDPCPPEMALIGRYCVDRWEGHLLTKNDDGSKTVWSHFSRPENNTFFAHSGQGVFPQAYISRVEAKRACTNSGKRLCSRAEWMRACKGSRGFRYPYGNTGKRGACNTGKAHLLFAFFGKKGWTYENFNDPKLNQEPGFLAKSGEYETCHSDEDVYDIVGNLHEWINDDVGTDIEQVLEKDGVERKEQPWRAGNGMFMGGFFSTTVEHGPGCTYTTIAHEPTYHDYSTGFRCCKTAILPDKPSQTKKKSKTKK
jgi:formylglycine-generating enzyme